MRTQLLPIPACAALAVCVFTYHAMGQQPSDSDSAPGGETGTSAEPSPAPEASPDTMQPAEAPPEPAGPPTPTTETQCSDGIDNDGDGMLDCADPDCQADAACSAPPVVAASPTIAEADNQPAQPPPSKTLGLEGVLGVSGRLGSMSSGYNSAERAGIQYGAGVFFSPYRELALGLSYTYSGFGAEEFNPSVNDATGKIRRSLHNGMLNIRAYPLRNDTIGLWVGLGAGITWQTATASGAVTTNDFVQPSRSYQVSAGPDAGLALGAALGMDYDVSNDMAVLASLALTNHRLTSEPLDGSTSPAVPGSGSASQLDFRFAFQYRFDLTGTSAPVTATVQTASSE